MKKTMTTQQFIDLGHGDVIYNYISKWPLLKLDVLNKKSIWNRIQDRLAELESEDKLNALSHKHLSKFFLNRPEIDFEINFFDKSLSKTFVFKYDKKIYCYSYGMVKRKNSRKIYVRFYFDVNKALGLNLPI